MNIELYEGLKDKLFERKVADLNGITRPGVVFVEEKNEEFSSKTGITASKFITINGKRYFIKYPTLGALNAQHEIFAELLTSFIAKKVGIDCVDCKLAIDHIQQAIGIISPDFGEHFMYDNFGGYIDSTSSSTTSSEVMDTIMFRTKKTIGVEINREELIEKLNKLSCFDYLINQRDRHSENLAFVIKEENGVRKLDLAPIYDNANAFLRVYSKLYKLSPNDCKIYGMEQQKLLNSTYKDMLIKFQTLFGEKFEETMQEFENYYGLDVLFSTQELDSWKEKTQANVKDKIKQCRFRRDGLQYIPLEVTYAVIQRHKDEYSPEEFAKILRDFAADLDNYFNDESYSYSYKNFTQQTKGELATWKWYDECEELLNNLDSEEVKKAKQILDEKRKKYNTTFLTLAMDRRIVYHITYNQLKYFLLDDPSVFYTRKQDKSKSKYYARTDFSFQYSAFKELRAWVRDMEEKTNLSLDQEKELKETKKLLKKYLKYFNALIRKSKNYQDESMLEKIGLRYDKKLGIVEVGDENKSLL